MNVGVMKDYKLRDLRAFIYYESIKRQESRSRLTIKLDRLMIVSNQTFSTGFCMYH